MFDKKSFAKLLKEAKGSRSMRSYASLSDVSAAHLSRLSREIVESPPSPETLKKLSIYAENGVTLKSLMHACGYYEEPEAVIEEKQGDIARMLFSTNTKWSVRKGKHTDYELIGENGELWEWIEGGMPGEVYGKLAMLEPSKGKRSIVVRGKMEIDSFKKYPPKALQGTYSLIVVEGDSWKEILLKE